MVTVGLYIYINDEAKRVELFDDEKISINSSIQNVSDISKVYTDFSQSFTVPATNNNNKIFSHLYESSIDNGYDARTRKKAYIELDTIPFRSGNIQLEKASLKNGKPENYTITFFGVLTSLKDKFNGLLLKDLTSTAYDFNYTADLVKQKIVTTAASSDIMFPLISSDRYWNYNSATDPTNNISDTSYPIRYNELFPAMKLKPILNMIESEFGINFDGTTSEPSTFLNDARFTNAYLWMKNSEDFNPLFFGIPFVSSAVSYNLGRNITTWDVSTNTLNYVNPSIPTGLGDMYITSSYSARTSSSFIGSKVWMEIFYNGKSISLTEEVIVSTVINGTTYGTFSFSMLPSSDLLGLFPNSYKIPEGAYTYKFSADSTMSLTNILFYYTSQFGSSPRNTWEETVITVPNYTYNSKLKISSIFPEIKIEDFFSGLLKMFNLTCYSRDGVNYTIEQLEDYYSNGDVIDITKYVIFDDVDMKRVETYKKINFEYEKSNSLVNVGFNSANGIEYGSLFYDTGNDGQEYSIKLPFENLSFNNLSDRLQVGYALKSDLKKYIPKPVILYDYNPTALTVLSNTDFWFNTSKTGGTSTQHTSYKAFGQEYYDGTDTHSLNFNSQQSTLNNELILNSLYSEYYQNYISNIFNKKTRLIEVNALLPISLLTSIKLNDRLVIRDKRYIINTMKVDLTTGEVDFELINDFRTL